MSILNFLPLQFDTLCRSGTFVLVDTCLLEAQLSGTQAVNVKERLLDMRTYR